jgi:hypothetical protein
METVTVLNFEGTSQGSTVTEEFRVEVKATPLPLSPYRGNWINERLMSGCDATPRDDGECMARIGQRFKTDWVLWGVLREDAGRTIVDAQLIPTSDPSRARKLTFEIDDSDVPRAVRAAWQQISK